MKETCSGHTYSKDRARNCPKVSVASKKVHQNASLSLTIPNKPLANNMKTQHVVKAITVCHKEGDSTGNWEFWKEDELSDLMSYATKSNIIKVQ